MIKKMKNDKNDKLKNIIDSNLSEKDIFSDFKNIQSQAINPKKQNKIKYLIQTKLIFEVNHI